MGSVNGNKFRRDTDQLLMEWEDWKSRAPAESVPHSLPQIGYVRGSDTSEAAARSMDKCRGEVAQRVFEAIKSRGDAGATSDEIEFALGMSHQTCAARFTELKQSGWILDSGKRRKTRSGRSAAVHVAAPMDETHPHFLE